MEFVDYQYGLAYLDGLAYGLGSGILLYCLLNIGAGVKRFIRKQ